MASLASGRSMTVPLGVRSGSMRAGRFAFGDDPPTFPALMRGDSPAARGRVTAATVAGIMAEAGAYARGDTCVDNGSVTENCNRWLWTELSLNQDFATMHEWYVLSQTLCLFCSTLEPPWPHAYIMPRGNSTVQAHSMKQCQSGRRGTPLDASAIAGGSATVNCVPLLLSYSGGRHANPHLEFITSPR